MRSNSISLLLAMLMAFCVGSLSAQSLYSEDFENETPFNANDLCATGNEYAPADANWALGRHDLPGIQPEVSRRQ